MNYLSIPQLRIYHCVTILLSKLRHHDLSRPALKLAGGREQGRKRRGIKEKG